MAHAHETQAKISLLKKSPAAYAKGFCATVRKFFATCQENIYSLSRKYLQPIHKIFTVCRKDSHCTVRNILRVQSETFCVYSQKHSACTVGKIPAVLAEKSPQYTRKKTCKCTKKCYFGMKFTQIARISRFAVVCAVLFCVCGAASATDYYFDPDKTFLGSPGGDFNTPANWKIFDGSGYSVATVIPMTSDSAFFGKSLDVPNGLQLKDTDYNIVIRTNNAAVSYLYVCFSNDSKSVGTVSFSNFPNGNFDIKMVTDNFIIYNDNENTKKTIFLNTMLTVNSDITIPSGIKVTVGRGYSTTINGNITIERGGSLEVNSTLNVNGEIINNGTIDIGTDGKIEGKITNATDGTINIGDGTLASNGAWSNKGTVTVGNGTATFTTSATDEGTWLYSTSRTTGIADIQYNVLWIGEDAKVKINNNLVATTSVIMDKRSELDLERYEMYTNGIMSNGTIRLYGTQNITSPYISVDTIEFYGDTETIPIKVSKMALSGTTFSTLVCDLSNGNDEKVLDFTGVKLITKTLTLKGNTENPLVIRGTAEINLNGGTGSNLRIDYKNVQLRVAGTPYRVTDSLGVGEAKTTGVRNGWDFGGVAEYYFWKGDDGNWSDYQNHWLQDDVPNSTGTRIPASNYPGDASVTAPTDFGGYHVYIQTSPAIVTLNVAAAIADVTINVNNTLEIGTTGTSELKVSDAWTNDGTVNLGGDGTTTGSVTLPTDTTKITENGTWWYINTTARDLVNINYNNLQIGNGMSSSTVTTSANVVAKSTVRVNTSSTLNLQNDISATNFEVNASGTLVTTNTVAINCPFINGGNTTNNGTFIANGSFTHNSGTFTNSGTLQINSTVSSSARISNSASSEVIFSGTATVDVAQLAINYQKLTCTTGGKTLNFNSDVSVDGDMTLQGTDGNLLTITTTTGTQGAPVVITLAAKQVDNGNYLDIDFDKVNIGTSPFDVFTYGVINSKKLGSDKKFWGNQNGWLFPEMSNVFYWVGVNDNNWADRQNWLLGDMETTPDNYPGNAGGVGIPDTTSAEVHIEPTAPAAATVVLNTDALIASLAINNRATLQIETNTLTINNSFTNSGNVSVGNNLTVSGAWNNSGRIAIINGTANVTLPTNPTENGTWRYTSTRASVFDLEYNNLEIGDGVASPTVTLNRAVTAKDTITVLSNATLAADANNITASSIAIQNRANLTTASNTINADSITNSGAFTTTGNTINANNIINSGTFTATGTQTISGKAGALSATQITNSNTMQFANVNVNGSLTNNAGGNISATGAATITTLTNNANSNATFNGDANITTFTNNASGNTTNVTFGSNATVANFTNSGTVNFTGATPAIIITGGTNSGTVRIDGNPSGNVGVTNSANSTVNYTISATGVSQADVNFGTIYGNLVCAPNASNKTLNFNQDIRVNGNLTLNGTNGKLLTITSNSSTNITLARANQSGSYLKINHDHVSINSTGFSPYYNVGKTSTDGNGTIPIGNMHGWLFELQDDYYWFGPSGGNWNEPANWRFSDSQSSPAPTSPSFYPGNAGSTPPTTGAKVHITLNTATAVALNTDAQVYSVEMNNNATLDIPSGRTLATTNSFTNNGGKINLDGTLNANATWNNTGTVNVKSENATFSSRTVNENGTWNYTTARTDLVPVTYNVLNLHGSAANTTITPTAAITANTVSIDSNTTLVLGANNLTVRNSWSNTGAVTVTSGNATFGRQATDNGMWIYNNTTNRDIIGNINYNNLNLNGPGWIIPQSNISARAKIAIGSDGKLDLAGRNISAANITNNGRVRLYGTQNVGGTVANEPNSTVEYYGDTYATPININRFGSTYGNFIMRGYNKTLNVNESIAVNGDLVLQGKDVDNMLTVTRTASGTATITVNKRQASSVTANPPAGNFIAMQRRNISITGTEIGDYKGSPYYYYAENSYDLDDYNVDVLRNGWRFKPVISLENISFTLTSIGSNRFYFRTTPANMAELGNVPTKLFDMLLHRYFAVVTPKSPLAPNATLKIDAATAPQRITNGSNLAWIGLSLTNNISLQDLQNFYIRADKQTEVNQYSFHALSDFAIDVVAPRYAFDNRHLDSGNAEEAAGGVAIRNWDRDQESNGQLVTKSDITISAGLNVDGLGVPVIYFDASPDVASISTRYNSDAGGDWRIWLPQAFASLSPVANSDYITFEEGASVGGNSLRFDLPVTKGEKFSSWKAGDQISFLFELKDANGNGMTVCHEPVLDGTVLNVSATAPLYALRLQVPEDITTLDLWSFKLRDIKSQRGSITIMNNVINVLSGENMILDVNVPVSGVLNIMVMTLDGTIVKYLQHGNVSQGKHVYHWDGRNNAGKPVARGLYFIRIVGCTIDESRKVMAVWK